MIDIFEIEFPVETYIKENVIVKFSNKQGGAYSIFSYYWQCFVWAATIGFLRNERRELKSPIEKFFSLNTMRNNNGEKDAQALICMCVARSGSLDIMKDPKEAVKLISEYANAGFYHIISLMENGENSFNDFEQVKQEIFSRDYDQSENLISTIANKTDDSALEEIDETNEEDVETPEEPEEVIQATEKFTRWTFDQERELYSYYKQGLSVEQLAQFLNKSEDDITDKLKNKGLI